MDLFVNSILFVPAKEKMMNKISSLSADAYIIDLEDSISDNEKDDALVNLKKYLDSCVKNSKIIFVRLNSNRLDKEIELLKEYDSIGFMIPKFENYMSYNSYESVLLNHKVIALIETPLGVLNAVDTAKCNWVDAIAFGAEDYTSMVNMKKSNETLLYQKSHIITCAKAYNKKVYDTPCFSFEEDILKHEVEFAVDLGFDGKLAINPKQISLINEEFRKSDIEFIKYIVDEYESSNESVLKIDGIIYEKMHIQRFKKILKENERL